MKFKLFSTLLILSTQVDLPVMSQNSDDSFTVFCTGNQDSTGTCLEASNSEEQKKLDCIMVPGNIIDCKNEADEQIECILIAATSAQAEFSCNKNTESSIEPEATIPIESPATQINNDINNTIDDEDNNEEKIFNTSQTNPFNNPFK